MSKPQPLTLYGAGLPFTVEYNINGIRQYPNETGEPAEDRYRCRRCNGVITHTMDGVFMRGDDPETQLFRILKRHMELCQLVNPTPSEPPAGPGEK